ncbi:MAG: hypothetical protein QM698_00515 [Micropepsaceae bacterium]
MESLDFTELASGEQLELFARDFLAELGMVIETPPGRGADAGQDLIVSEQLKGHLASRKFVWLVSCKNFATSGSSVGVNDEQNILERLAQHKADGFLGIYATIPSAALVTRLSALVSEEKIVRYEIFDAAKITAAAHEGGMSKIISRFFPISYAKSRPIQKLFDKYEPIECANCGVDLLLKSVTDPYSGILVVAMGYEADAQIENVYVCCKGDCDRALAAVERSRDRMTAWEDIGDLVCPLGFIRNVLAYANRLQSGSTKISAEAHRSMANIYAKLAQRTLRESNSEDGKRVSDLISLEGM